MNKALIILLSCCLSLSLSAQNIILEGYVFESNNRGYLNQVKIVVIEYETGFLRAETFSDEKGFFQVEVPGGIEYQINATKKEFILANVRVKTTHNEKAFAKVQMDRKPGYLFDMTFAKAREGNEITDGLTGLKLEVFNNTTNEEMLVIDSTRSQNVQFSMEQGNHYTFLIRKFGYFTKRIEAYVNVKGCILCIDGVDNVNPGVSDNLTQGFKMGTLLANIELQPLVLGKSIQVRNIYYDLGSAALRPEAKKELDKLAKSLKDNPFINVEMSSHTDARGDALSNLNLSQRRADAVVEYLVSEGKIDGRRLTAAGYGETRLVNRCSDDNIANCNESEHQQNRRTELKITQINKDEFFSKSLKTIIREENMELTLVKNADDFNKQVSETDEMPEDLRRYIEEQKKLENGTRNDSDHSTQIPLPTPKPTEKKEQTKIINNEATKNNKTDLDPNKDNGEIVIEHKVKPLAAKKIVPLSADFSGYMVEILTNKKELAASNEIFTRFSTLTMEHLADGNIAYLAGNFKNYEQALQFFNEAVKKRYPKAKIWAYKAGKRVIE
jgi:outer membrane protein OmpA-like peptidoglycan-associated protein